ncbi:Transaldolase [hydrothermal vent metagenome]|uniref:Transaldolase n=1 Tax=hydrothermal vent metagenome TaxID=652676 RepID=A0A3B1CWS3_9ZZZZ
MSNSTIQQLADYGQSIWLDYISRSLLETDKLKNLIKDGLRGMTSNPSIFNQAIGSSNDYDEKISQLKSEGKSTFEIYDALTIQDIQDATDIFKGVYESTNALDGYVSLEINPQLANDAQVSIKEGLRLYKEVNRPNVMIKVPATSEGYPVIEELTAQGINVNATLIFSLAQYEQTVLAYLRGLKRLAQTTDDLSKVHSVASVFISRIDAAVDKLIEDEVAKDADDSHKARLLTLCGRAAVANSRIIFEKSKEMFSSQEFQDLITKKANIQRVLWASTGTKNPDYSDVKYVTELIASPTVNTLPAKTLMAFLDHGEVKGAFDYDFSEAQECIDALAMAGIDVDQVCQQLLEAGVVAFEKAFEELFDSIVKKAEQFSAV